MSYKKGHIPWHKGKKLSDEHKRKISLSLKGKKLSEYTKFKIKLANKGKRLSEETKRKIGLANKGRKISEETKQKMSLIRKRLFKEGKIKIPNHKGKKHPYRTELNKLRKGYHHSEKTKRKISLSKSGKSNFKISKIMKLLWQNPEYKSNQIKAQLKGLIKRPTSLEKQMIDIIQKHNLPYKYVGNGEFILGGKNPDFININGEKTAIEVRSPEISNIFDKKSPEEYTEERQRHFAKYGWKCIVFVTNKLNEKEVLKCI